MDAARLAHKRGAQTTSVARPDPSGDAAVCVDAAEEIQRKQQRDAARLLRRLEQVGVADLTIHYRLEGSSATLPGTLIRFVVVSVLFRLDSVRKWHLAWSRKLLPEVVGRWLKVESLAEMAEYATVDWVPPQILLDTLAWQVGECLTQFGLPQPAAVIRQTIAALLLREAKRCGEGVTLDRSCWRRMAEKGKRRLPAAREAECQQRINFVLGQVDLSEVAPRRWLKMPELTAAERVRLEAVRVAAPSERLQALQHAFAAGLFDFVPNLLACSYSRHGRRAHHPLLLLKIWLAILAVGSSSPGEFLHLLDDSLQLRLFLEVMSQQKLPSERRIKGFVTERLAPVIEYLVLWQQFLLIRQQGIDIDADFGTDSADMHAQARMKSDAAAKQVTGLLGWLIAECRRFCAATGRTGFSAEERAVLQRAFEELNWKSLGNFGRSRQGLLHAIRDTLGGQFVTPLPSPVAVDCLPRAGPVPVDVATLAQELAAEWLARMNVFGANFDSSVCYDPEGSAHTKRGKTVHGYGVQFLADLNFGLIWAFAVFPAGDGFRPQIAEWVVETKRLFGWERMQLTSDREYTIAKAIHQWHAAQVFHYGPRADIDEKKKGIFSERDFAVHEQYAICPNGMHLQRKPNLFVRGSSEQWRYQAKASDCLGCPLRGQCTTGKNPRMLCVNVYREDLEIHAARMKADPQRTRDLLGRHRATSEGIVNNLMNHHGVRRARWKGLALARVQVGLAIVMLNTLKWFKIRCGQLTPMTLSSAV
jgi:hypothetical protein